MFAGTILAVSTHGGGIGNLFKLTHDGFTPGKHPPVVYYKKAQQHTLYDDVIVVNTWQQPKTHVTGKAVPNKSLFVSPTSSSW